MFSSLSRHGGPVGEDPGNEVRQVSRYFDDERELIVTSLSSLRGQPFLSLNSTSKTRWRLNVV